MIVKRTYIDGIFIVTPEVFHDKRGYFFESYNFKRYIKNKISVHFVQDNESMSKIGTIRGLHLQMGNAAQGKLVTVIKGAVQDVAVDLRLNSPTFGKYFSIKLDDNEKKQIYIPPGFAHGFATLIDNTILHYKCTEYYEPCSELTLLWNDPTVSINWLVSKPIISKKDREGKTFNEIKEILLRGEI